MMTLVVVTSALFAPPYTFVIFPLLTVTFEVVVFALFPPPKTFPEVPPLTVIFDVCVVPPSLFPP